MAKTISRRQILFALLADLDYATSHLIVGIAPRFEAHFGISVSGPTRVVKPVMRQAATLPWRSFSVMASDCWKYLGDEGPTD